MQLLDNIETAQRQNKLFAALKQGNEAIKQLQKEVTLDDVENLMSDSAEAKEQQVLFEVYACKACRITAPSSAPCSAHYAMHIHLPGFASLQQPSTSAAAVPLCRQYMLIVNLEAALHRAKACCLAPILSTSHPGSWCCLQDRMRELLGQSLTPEADEAALEELRALEADEEAADAAAQEADLPEVPTVWHLAPTQHYADLSDWGSWDCM